MIVMLLSDRNSHGSAGWQEDIVWPSASESVDYENRTYSQQWCISCILSG